MDNLNLIQLNMHFGYFTCKQYGWNAYFTPSMFENGRPTSDFCSTFNTYQVKIMLKSYAVPV